MDPQGQLGRVLEAALLSGPSQAGLGESLVGKQEV